MFGGGSKKSAAGGKGGGGGGGPPPDLLASIRVSVTLKVAWGFSPCIVYVAGKDAIRVAEHAPRCVVRGLVTPLGGRQGEM